MNAPRRLWYVKRNDQPVGPFPEAALIQDLLLGRLTRDTLVSDDRATWVPLARVADMQPHASADDSGWEEERRRALLRWADQRLGAEPHESDLAGQGSDRRQERRENRATTCRSAVSAIPRAEGNNRAVAWRLALVLIALALGIALIALVYGPSNPIDVRIR